MIVTIKLEFDRESLWQWDLKQRLILTGVEEGVEVHFSSPFVRHNEALRRPTYIEDGVMYANIPDSLLQKSGYIRAFIYTSTNTELGEAHTIDSINFKVKERKKPQNYICEEEEILLYNALMERVKNLENKEVDINEETFVVIIRQTGSGDYKSYHMNKTFEELQKAFNDGKALLCRYLNTTYVLWSYYDDQKEFVFINISENNKTSLGLVHINSEKIYINSTLLSSVYYTKEDKYYTPTQEYHLTPKKYVDEALSKINFNVLEEADIIPFGEYIVYTPVEINGEIKMPIVGETYTMLAKNMSIDSIAYGKEIVVETVAKSNGKGVLLLFKNIPYDFYSSNIVFDFYNNHCTLSTNRGTYLIKLTGKTEAKIITEKSLKDYLPTQENWYICDEIDAQGRPVISEPKEDMYYLVQLTQTVENEVEYDVWSFSSNKWVLVDRLTMTYEEDNNNNNNEYELQQATEENLGGVKASPKTDNDTVEAKIGEDGKLYVPTYPEQNEIPVDSALDKTSTNPVQNKAVAEAVEKLSNDKLNANALPDAINTALTQAKESGEFDGTNGTTPHIGANGNWFIGESDTGNPSRGEKGDTGEQGPQGIQGEKGATGADGKNGSDGQDGEDGADGITPHIGENGNWYIGEVDTGVSATGETTSITVDDKLNKESTNPIQNKTVAEAVDRLSEEIDDKEASGTAQTKVNEHNVSEESHSDIRLLISGLTSRLNTLANSDDMTLDQMAEVVAYIKNNKSLIDGITTGKVSVSDIIDNLTTSVSNKPLSAKQGVQLKALIDAIVVPTKTSQLQNDSNFVQKSELPTITQEAGESESLVMSQKATTDLIKSMIPETDETEYETVDSVSEMTDTSKQYVLSTTGTIWTYGEVTENVNVNDQIFDASKAFTGHTSGVNILSSSNKLYPLSIDISQIPQDVEAYVEIDGFYERNTTSPYMEKVGFSALENPKQGNSQILKSFYVSTKYLDLVSTTKGCRIKVGYGTDTPDTTAVKIDGYETIKTMLLEIPSAQTHDASTIKVYLQYSYSGTVTKWYDTELEPSTTGGGGGNTIELLVKINQNTTDIYEMGQRVTALETGSDTLTIPSFWQSAVDECIAKIKALQVGRNCITVPFFSDNHQRNGYAGLLIAYIMKECNIPYCFYGGDSISNGTIANETEMIAQDKAFDTIMSYIPNGRLCRAVGNHDGYWYDGTNKYYYDRPQVYELFLREESIAQNKHFGGDGTYYYVDDLASKTRFVVMNMNGGSVDSAQLSWVQNTALSFNESGWGVVFISHQPISNHYHAGISNAKDVASAISTTATSKNVPIMGWYSGHVHRDILSTKVHTGGNGSNVGTENGDLGFTQVIITSDHTGISYDDATKHTVANDDKSHAIDFATFNKSTRTVNITRLGIGSDRSYTY